MSEHLTDEQIEGYRKRELQPQQLLAADRHCLSCERCRSRLNESGKLQAAFKNLKENLQTGARERPEHLEYGLLEAYVDNRVDELDREIVESHIALCADCADELQELQAFAAMLRSAATAEAKPTEKVSLWQRWFSFNTPMAVFRLAGAAVALLLIAAGAIFMVNNVLNSKPGAIARGNDNRSLPPNQNPNANQQVQPQNPVIAQGNQNAANRNTPTPQPQPASVFAFLVPLDISRGGGDERSTLKISPDVGFVDLKVEVQNGDGKSFGAQLQKIGGTAQTLKASRAQNGIVRFRVMARSLTNGQYYLKVYATPRDSNRSDIETVFKVERLQK
jgi:anti-sigma factor RsiW